MKIKLTRTATWGGNQHKAGSVCNVSELIGKKLIERGYAKLNTAEQKEPKDAPTVSE